MMEKELLELKVKDLVPYKNNPRINAKAVSPVAESIKETGYNNPIIVDENNVILAGHTRQLSLLKLGVDKVKVIRISGLTDEQQRAYRLLDNKTGELAEWDLELLYEELDGLDFGEFDIDWGFPEPKEEKEKTKKEKEYECPHCGFVFEQ